MNTNPFKWPITIYYEDTDAGGVVYHSNYLKFFERARTELLRDKGVSQQVMLNESIGFVVKSLQIDFISAARLDEQLIVETLITEIKKVSLTFCQILVNSDGKVLCKATVKVACVDNSVMKPTAIPSFILSEISCDR
ncbi:tol-pal system-associated acyl-CoA thioesterase [Aliivibrio fischeri]|uniref:Tol-pal system-associated acyl-CoA thioesterase n=2 Tax=Aliivibrio fischeri TaxID=668 RepID=A0A1B9PCX2_ALIFS|nr:MULTISPECIES: tol-pal system-associated acyl-CoA thioesterase [Aliivibrio]EHN70596.1 acyl-CoA thioesterase [Aliivibrio fischeri SR5]MBD1568081.1 tol-pal system-associated acyl-CoA thioesterase [Aliivibrio sp. S10_S31]MBP3141509.1 tol-pal system-associated acyl-CoA thioesterase [Aliivibrio fischeri]MBP3157871.1 tol-pal system-associated acyl-CoA thioesterase [Aliivibrio fischeri]MCE7534506.1 tol-pal system-associated acyl-CoA thioesterase [Aliivibrio fischeri]